MNPPLAVAVLNSSDDMIELLRVVLEGEGYFVASAHVDDVVRGRIDLVAFLKQHRPSVILYDVTPPYERHWMALQHLRQHELLRDLPFVLTTTNVPRLREAIRSVNEPLVELVGRPFELDEIVQSVARALAT